MSTRCRCRTGSGLLANLAITAMLLLSLGAGSGEGERTPVAKRILWSDTPVVVTALPGQAPRNLNGIWERSVYPIGNGRLGCTVFGEPQKDRIQFNEDSLWVGNEDCTGGYQPFGDVYIEMPHTQYSDYRRELDISRAVQTITPQFADAARVSLIARGGGGPGWGMAMRSCVFARLLDADRAYSMIENLLASKIHGNLWAVHPPFQIDANFGYAAGVNEMLAQSHLGFIHLLPALPRGWQTGSVRGMRVRGGYEVDIEWKDGVLTRAIVRGISNGPGKCAVRYGKETASFALARGESRMLSAADLGQSHGGGAKGQ